MLTLLCLQTEEASAEEAELLTVGPAAAASRPAPPPAAPRTPEPPPADPGSSLLSDHEHEEALFDASPSANGSAADIGMPLF